MPSRGLQRRAKKEAIRQDKERLKTASKMMDTVREALPRLDDAEVFYYDKGGYSTGIVFNSRDVINVITSKSELAETFRKIADQLKKKESKEAFKWAADFEKDPLAKDFVRSLSPDGFDKLAP